MVNDVQVRKLMEELSKHGEIGKAAIKAGMGPWSSVCSIYAVLVG